MTFSKRMRLAALHGFWLVALIIVGCGDKNKMNVASAFGPSIRFTELGTTYDWREPAIGESNNQRLSNPNLRALITDTIQSELAARGFSEAGDDADFAVTYLISTKVKLEEYRGSGFTEFEEGSLVIELLDPETNVLMWRGVAQVRLNDTDPPDVRRRRIQDAVRGIFDALPGAAHALLRPFSPASHDDADRHLHVGPVNNSLRQKRASAAPA